MGPRPHLWCFAFQTGTLAPEWQVSVGPSPHLRLLHAKQRLLDQKYKSLWVLDVTDVFFSFKTATLAPEFRVSMCPSPHLWFRVFTTATLCPELIVTMGPRTHLSLCAFKNRD